MLKKIAGDEEDVRDPTRLKTGQIGLFGLTALAIGVVSPALGLFALWGPMEAAAGPTLSRLAGRRLQRRSLHHPD